MDGLAGEPMEWREGAAPLVGPPPLQVQGEPVSLSSGEEGRRAVLSPEGEGMWSMRGESKISVIEILSTQMDQVNV